MFKQGNSFKAAAESVCVDITNLKSMHFKLFHAPEASGPVASAQELTAEEKRVRKHGIRPGAITAFDLPAPLFNPLSLLYGPTLSRPMVIVGFALGALAVVTILGAVWDSFALKPYQQMQTYILRKKLESLEHAIEHALEFKAAAESGEKHARLHYEEELAEMSELQGDISNTTLRLRQAFGE